MAALALGHPKHHALLPSVRSRRARAIPKAAYILGFYHITVDAASCAKYARGHVEPQFRGLHWDPAWMAFSDDKGTSRAIHT